MSFYYLKKSKYFENGFSNVPNNRVTTPFEIKSTIFLYPAPRMSSYEYTISVLHSIILYPSPTVRRLVCVCVLTMIKTIEQT